MTAGTITFQEPEPDMCMVPCFTPGTTICTITGTRAIETLEVGDLLLTRDNGFKPIAWIGIKRVEGAQLAAHDEIQPICIPRGSLGDDCPNRDMMVSRQHRMLLTGVRADLLFGSNEVIVKAKDLVSQQGIHEARVEGVTYVHIMFDQHEIVLANEAWTEIDFPRRARNGPFRKLRLRADIFKITRGCCLISLRIWRAGQPIFALRTICPCL